MRDIIGRINGFDGSLSETGNSASYVVTMQGCPLRCLYCDNPGTWLIGDGREVAVSEIIKDMRMYSHGRLTITGGEPLLQPEFCRTLIEAAHNIGYITAIDTPASVPIEASREAIKASDMVVLNIKDMDKTDCEVLTGFDNFNLIDTFDYCEAIQKPVLARYVLLPGYTMSEEKLRQLGSAISVYSCVKRLELIPYHKKGLPRWAMLGLNSKLINTDPPSENEIAWSKWILNQYIPMK
ncbi:MAG: radical SAM protein [Ruminococcus sp.]|nr:radical SAM protein [Ruminococcus sp.]